jgi:hypothetical protein
MRSCSNQLEAVDRKQENVAERMEGMQVGLERQGQELEGISDSCNKMLMVSFGRFFVALRAVC